MSLHPRDKCCLLSLSAFQTHQRRVPSTSLQQFSSYHLLNMFAFPKNGHHISKCFFTYSEMPELINEKQPPVKKKPFSTIQSHPFTHTVSEFCLEVSSSCLHIDQVDLILPEEIYSIIEQKFNSDESALRYARVKISLLEVLSGEFFNQYIKAGWQGLPPEGHGTDA